MLQRISRSELIQAQAALSAAITLQIIVWLVNSTVFNAQQLLIIAIELVLIAVIGLSVGVNTLRSRKLFSRAAITLLAILSFANIISLILVLFFLIIGHEEITGLELLSSAIAIFITNIIVFALWYWEIDSPGLTLKKWSKYDKDFQFTHQDLKDDFPDWKPEFLDYLYLSVTNAVNFAPADSRPLTRLAKLLMGSQALISVFTLALVIARSASILGV